MPNQFTASLWGDEAFSAILSQKSLIDIITTLVKDTSPPGYYFFEHFWMKIFGISEISIRTLSFLLFLLTVFFVYKIGALVWDKKTGVIAASLTFLNPFLFIYAFEGRMYSIMAAFVAGSMYFFLKRNWLLYVITTTIALYSHHFAVFAVFVQGLWFIKEFLWEERKTALSMFKSFLAVFLLYLPWLYPLYLQTTMVGSGFWLSTPALYDLWELIRKFLSEAIPHKLATPSLYLLGTVLILRRWNKNKEITLFLSLWFLLPLFLTYFISQFFQPIFFDRYMLYAIPGATLILASQRRRFSYLPLMLAVVFLLLVNLDYFTHPTKKPFNRLAQYVQETRQPGDVFIPMEQALLINHNAAAHHLWESKYYGIPAPIWVPEGELPFYVGTALMEKGDTIKELPEAERIGVISSGRVEEVSLPGYTRSETVGFGSLKVAWYLKAR